MTPAERKLWSALRETFPGDHWRKQVPFGPYTVDFCSHRRKLIIEVDSSQHALRLRHDAVRTRFLEAEGYRVIRFWNHEVLTHLEGVIGAVVAARAKGPE